MASVITEVSFNRASECHAMQILLVSCLKRRFNGSKAAFHPLRNNHSNFRNCMFIYATLRKEDIYELLYWHIMYKIKLTEQLILRIMNGIQNTINVVVYI